MRNTLFIVPFIILALFNYSLSAIYKKPFGRTMPVSAVLCMALMYISQFLLKSFVPGLALIVVLGAASIPFIVKRKVKSENDFVEHGLWLFIGISAFILVWDLGRNYTIFDEFYFWGPMVKESLRLDNFYSIPESGIQLHKDYPPFITLIEYLWCKCSGGYSESGTSMAVHMTLLSASVLPVAERYLGKSHKRITYVLIGVLLSAAFFVVVFVLDPWTPRESTSILVDVLVSVIFAYAIYLIYVDSIWDGSFGILELCLLNTAIIMIKQVGIGFLMVITFYGVLEALLRSDNKGKTILRYMITLAVPIAVSQSWEIYTKHLGIGGQFDFSHISIKTFIEIVSGQQRGLQHDTLKSYLYALFQKNISTSWSQITYASSLVIALLLLYFIYIWCKGSLKRERALSIGAAFVCCTLGYALVMAILYTFCFNESEMRILASYERYMSSFVLGQILFLLYLFMDLSDKRALPSTEKRKNLAIIIMVAILLAPGNLLYLTPQALLGNQHAREKKEANYISDHTEKGASICLIYDANKESPSWYGAYRFYMLYYSEDRFFPSVVDMYNADYNNQKEVQTVINSIQSCDYLYVKDAKKEFVDCMKEYTGENEIKDNEVYHIETDGQKMHLNKVS